MSTSDYYKRNGPARRKRNAQQTRYNKSGKGNKIAREATRLNRKLGTYGNGDGLDAAHYKGSATEGRTQKASINRRSRLKAKKGGK